MKRMDCFKELVRLRQDELVVTHMGVSATEWLVASGDQERTFYLKSAMGMVSSFSLGLALTIPSRSIWGIDGDGSFILNFGGLLTLAENQPPNMKHFVLSNRCYESTGGKLVNADNTDYVGIARAAGIKNAYSFDDIAVFKREIDPIVRKHEYAMIVLEIEQGADKYEVYPADPIEQTYKFGRHLEQSLGLSLFKYQP